MALTNMTHDDILDALNAHVGATGLATLRHAHDRAHNALYIQREENSDWQYVGTVRDPGEAHTAIDDWFDAQHR